jgi:ATP-binding cassette subfamily B protein
MANRRSGTGNTKPGIISILKPYKVLVSLLILLTLAGNGINLVIPKIISKGIDAFNGGHYIFNTIFIEFITASLAIFFFSYLQSIVQTYVSEKVARDLRKKLSDKISGQAYSFIIKANPSKLLTNLTSDIDSIKMFVAQAVSSIVSSLIIIIGASILLLKINWKLALTVIAMIPLIAITFFIILGKVKVLFTKSREVIDWLNKIINESILGSAIIRVINSQQEEYNKFMAASTQSKEIGISVLTLFATLIPVITFVANLATLSILALGGHFVINGNLSLGDFAAFNSYVAMLVFPILIIGFMSNIIVQASASRERIEDVLKAPDPIETGTIEKKLTGAIELRNIHLYYDERPVLKNVSFSVEPGSQTAILGPTAAGKSQLLYLITGLIQAGSGTIEFDGEDISFFKKNSFYKQIGFVFQDSIIFNMSIRENIAFNDMVTDESFHKAVETAELNDFIDSLPMKADTIISERGTSLSGGQKQRIMLARALAMNPGILLLDDFTARVDKQTEQKIMCNIFNNYPGLTLISITQKISTVKNFDRIVLLMEGEVIAQGKHKELLANCPEYVQIYNSQRTTRHYEL